MTRMVGLLLLGCICFVTPHASAATMRGNQFEAESGEVNAVTFSHDPATGTWTITDQGAVIVDGAPFDYCVASGHVATCDATKGGFMARLGDGDDSLTVASPLPARLGAVVFGDSGNDRLDAGAGATSGTVVLMGGTGDDLLLGSPVRDGLSGDDGDDTIFGNGGGDFIDGVAAPNRVFNAGAGRDGIDGGPGSDMINGVEPGDVPAQPDRIACGEGDEGLIFPPTEKDNHLGDETKMGEGDLVGTDCEYLGQATYCGKDEHSDLCEVDGVHVARGAQDPAAGATGDRLAPPLVFRARVKAGKASVARARLTKRLSRRLLRGRKIAKVRSVVRVRSGGEQMRLEGLRFRLRRR
jgi:Ca2+-binding RTX toxin-like protein